MPMIYLSQGLPLNSHLNGNYDHVVDSFDCGDQSRLAFLDAQGVQSLWLLPWPRWQQHSETDHQSEMIFFQSLSFAIIH